MITPEERQLIDEMIRAAQTIRIIQVQATATLDSMKGHSWATERDKADRAWRRINEAHESLVTGMRIPKA